MRQFCDLFFNDTNMLPVLKALSVGLLLLDFRVSPYGFSRNK